MKNTYVSAVGKVDSTNTLMLVYNNTYCIKEILKDAGYKFDDESCHWYKIIDKTVTKPKDELANLITLTNGLTNIVRSKPIDIEAQIAERLLK